MKFGQKLSRRETDIVPFGVGTRKGHPYTEDINIRVEIEPQRTGEGGNTNRPYTGNANGAFRQQDAGATKVTGTREGHPYAEDIKMQTPLSR